MKNYIIILNIKGGEQRIEIEGEDQESAYKQAIIELVQGHETCLFYNVFELSNENKVSIWHWTPSRAHRHLSKSVELKSIYEDTRMNRMKEGLRHLGKVAVNLATLGLIAVSIAGLPTPEFIWPVYGRDYF